MKKSSALSVILMIASLSSICFSATPSYQQNFDIFVNGAVLNDVDSSWMPSNGITIISNEKSSSAPNSLKLIDNSSSVSAQARKEFGDAKQQGEIHLSLYIPSNNTQSCYVTLFAEKFSSANRYIDLNISSSGNVQRRTPSSASLEQITAINLDVWNKIEINWSNNSYQITINGTLIGKYPAVNNTIPDRLELKAGTNSETNISMFVDDLQLFI